MAIPIILSSAGTMLFTAQQRSKNKSYTRSHGTGGKWIVTDLFSGRGNAVAAFACGRIANIAQLLASIMRYVAQFFFQVAAARAGAATGFFKHFDRFFDIGGIHNFLFL